MTLHQSIPGRSNLRSRTVVSTRILNVRKFILCLEGVSQFPKTFFSAELLRCLSFDATFPIHSYDIVRRFVPNFQRKYRGQVDELCMISSDRWQHCFLLIPFFFNKNIGREIRSVSFGGITNFSFISCE